MPQPASPAKASFAYVYDALYSGDTPFLRAQLAFLEEVFGPPPVSLLDIGCGTGIHVAALSELGYPVTGADIDHLMLQAARRKMPGAALVHADMRRLPFGAVQRGEFAGALCLESPLAYLLNDEDLHVALRSIGATLIDGASLVIDVFDYPGTLGAHPMGASRACFSTPAMRVEVVESHRYDEKQRIWTMRQAFQVDEEEGSTTFEVVHRLRVRSMDEYAGALEAAGFTPLQALAAYPNCPDALRDERRLIFVVRRAARGPEHAQP